MRIFIISLFTALTVLLSGCNTGDKQKTKMPGSAHDHDHEHDHDHDHSDEIHFSAEQAEVVGLELETAEPGTFRQVIKTSGHIQSPRGDEVTIAATANGVISFLNRSLSQGMALNSGQTIANVSAQRLPDGDPAVKAKIAFETAEREYVRAENLVKDQIISVREFEEIRSRYETAKNIYESQASQHTGKGVSLNSPISGFVKSLLVKQGDFVSVGQPVAVVTQNRRLQLRAEVSENYFNNVRNIGSANFTMAYDNTLYKLEELNGRLVSAGKTADEQSFYIPVTFEFDNIGDIIPGSFAEVYLLSLPRENVLSVPVSAITDEQGLYFIYIQVHDEEYKKEEVELGQSDGERIEIVSGLHPGDKVVVKGVHQVKLAGSSFVIPEGHSH